MDWFLYDTDLCHERVKLIEWIVLSLVCWSTQLILAVSEAKNKFILNYQYRPVEAEGLGVGGSAAPKIFSTLYFS